MSLILKSLDFLVSSKNHAKACLDRLDHNILIDSVFIYLDADDLIRLRRVSKLYYYLTLHPAVWKRLLMCIDVPLPPLPPTHRHAFQELTGLEAEQLIVRAMSFDREWRKDRAISFKDNYRVDAGHHIHSMTFLSGGKFLVASVSNRSETEYGIMVFIMDHPCGRAVALMKVRTPTKAYHLQAKYLMCQGKQGIMLAFVIRLPNSEKDARRLAQRGIDLSQLAPDADLDLHTKNLKLKYQCQVLHFPLTALEDLGDPQREPGTVQWDEYARSQPSPGRKLVEIQSRSKLGVPCLDEINEQPYVAVPKLLNRIEFKNLNDERKSSILICDDVLGFPDAWRKILAIRLLGPQQQVIVVRQYNVTADINPYPLYPIELFNIPINNSFTDTLVSTQSSVQYTGVSHYILDDIQLTDHHTLSKNDDSVGLDLHLHAYSPRPISMFARTTLPEEGFIRLTFWPTEVFADVLPPDDSTTPQQCRFHYHFANLSPIWYQRCPMNEKIRVLPGSYRSCVYTVPWDAINDCPPISGLYAYFDTECLRREPPNVEMYEHLAWIDDYGARRWRAAGEVKPIDEKTISVKGKPVKAVAWDDTIGRFCFAFEKDTYISVLDFASAPRDDLKGLRYPLRYSAPTREAVLPTHWRDGSSDDQQDNDSRDHDVIVDYSITDNAVDDAAPAQVYDTNNLEAPGQDNEDFDVDEPPLTTTSLNQMSTQEFLLQEYGKDQKLQNIDSDGGPSRVHDVLADGATIDHRLQSLDQENDSRSQDTADAEDERPLPSSGDTRVNPIVLRFLKSVEGIKFPVEDATQLVPSDSGGFDGGRHTLELYHNRENSTKHAGTSWSSFREGPSGSVDVDSFSGEESSWGEMGASTEEIDEQWVKISKLGAS